MWKIWTLRFCPAIKCYAWRKLWHYNYPCFLKSSDTDVFAFESISDVMIETESSLELITYLELMIWSLCQSQTQKHSSYIHEKSLRPSTHVLSLDHVLFRYHRKSDDRLCWEKILTYIIVWQNIGIFSWNLYFARVSNTHSKFFILYSSSRFQSLRFFHHHYNHHYGKVRWWHLATD